MGTYLQINNLTKQYGHLTAVDNLSFSIEQGRVYGILGPNGSGKSTTLGMILNVINPTSGSFQWFDGQYDNQEALKKIGAIIEHPNFYPYMTAVQNLELVCKIKEIDPQGIEEKLELVGLLERKNDKFRTYSLGMKQRLAIASALLNNPKILILDEPTNGLDPQGIHQIREIILQIAEQGTTILMASHLLDEVEKICSHVVIIQNGKKLYEGPVEGMSSNFGYFELGIRPELQEELTSFLAQHPAFSKASVDQRTQLITVSLKEDMDADELNRILMDRELYLSHLVKRKDSLEKQFLEITQS